jgi:hypothetical protein
MSLKEFLHDSLVQSHGFTTQYGMPARLRPSASCPPSPVDGSASVPNQTMRRSKDFRTPPPEHRGGPSSRIRRGGTSD